MHDVTGLTPFERTLTDRLAVELEGSVLPFDPQAIADRAMAGRRSLNPRFRLLLLAAAALLLVGAVVAVGSGLIRLPWSIEPPLPWPLKGVLEPAGTLAAPTQGPMAVELRDGRVLVISPELNENNSPAELWDPATGSFQRAGPMTKAREGAQLVVLADGRVLVAGGDGVGWPPTAEVFDPRTATFSALASRPSTIESTAILLRDGRVLLSGGADRVQEDGAGNRGVASRAEVFDPNTGQFTRVGDMVLRRIWHELYLLRDGRVLVLGGAFEDAQQVDQPKAEIFDPMNGTFTLADRPALQTHIYDWSAQLPDGRLAILRQPGWAAYPDFPSQPMTVTFYDLETGAQAQGPTIPASAPVYDVRTTVPLTDRRLILLGFDKASYGHGASGILDRGWLGVLDLETGLLSNGIVRDASWGTILSLRDGRILILGGTQRGSCGPTGGATDICMDAIANVEILR
jgi:hypothetical protein